MFNFSIDGSKIDVKSMSAKESIKSGINISLILLPTILVVAFVAKILNILF